MIVSKRDSSNIYNGALAYLRESITAKLPENQEFVAPIGIKGFIGSEEVFKGVLLLTFSRPLSNAENSNFRVRMT